MPNLGPIFKKRRTDKGLKLSELSAMSGVHTSYLGRIERGERHPSGRILRKLAKPLGCSEIQLLKEAGFLSQDAIDDRLREVAAKDRLRRDVNVIALELLTRIFAMYTKIDEL